MRSAGIDTQAPQRRRATFTRIVIGVVIVLAALCGGVIFWANGIETRCWGPITSVPELLEKMPCFTGLEIESTQFQGRARWRRLEVPGMGMVWYETWGSMRLTEKGALALRSGYAWSESARGALPLAVRELGPEGTRFLVSEELNEKFWRENGGAHRNGFVLIDADSDGRTVHFVVRDDDHSLDCELH